MVHRDKKPKVLFRAGSSWKEGAMDYVAERAMLKQ
jgi:hypothetical protein